MITLQPNWKATTSAELPANTDLNDVDSEEVLRTLEKLYNDFTMRPDECKALDWAIRFIKEHTEEGEEE